MEESRNESQALLARLDALIQLRAAELRLQEARAAASN
jgi:hypothetical protein